MSYDVSAVRPWERHWIDAEEWHLAKDVQTRFREGVADARQALADKQGALKMAKTLGQESNAAPRR